MALNQLVACSKEQDWEVHNIEHQLSAYTNCSHGIWDYVLSLCHTTVTFTSTVLTSLFVLLRKSGRLMTRVRPRTKLPLKVLPVWKNLQRNVECGMVTTLKELGATPEMLPDITNSCIILDVGYHKITHKKILAILKQCYE